MIGNCFNPACQKELRYLRQGAVYQWEKGSGPEFDSEFFWLCPRCSCTFDVGSDRQGMPSLTVCGAKIEGNPGCSRIRKVLREIVQECPVAGCPAECAGERLRREEFT
jgi:hypothetical protein